MDVIAFLIVNWYSYILIPILIFAARIVDVSIGTIRVIFISRGLKFLAPLLGFFEVLIWLIAIQNILANLTNVFCYLGYAGGFATGTYIGILLEEKISMGKVIIRIITGKDASALLDALKNARCTVTSTGAEGPDGNVKLILSVFDRQDLHKVIKLIKKHNPTAFYSVEDVRLASDIVKDSAHNKKTFRRHFMKHAVRK
ncbi:MAG: DUF2179 domain-containing protein [Candidatus Aenigmarchaeota archaeon]|nr:DUF2179 domain-containing protein [Candidatus Aenigmarchaeota archaeon]